jgi:glycosyltransferase involved in cell wall biosynthesis
MRIAIFHNFMDNIGGAEMVDLLLARELNADIYTTNLDSEKIKKMGFSDVLPRIKSIGKIPINAPLRQELAYWRFRFLNVEKRFKKKYDIYIIAGDWAMAGARHNKPNFWYVYSPIREIWDLHKYTRDNIVSFWQKPFFDLWALFRRALNRTDVLYVQKIVSISKNVQGRIKKYFERDSIVIYPPTETKKFKFKKVGNYWLSVNRLITHKRIEIQLAAFSKLPKEKLIIVGSYEKSGHFLQYANKMLKLKPANVEIKSWVNSQELVKLYSECKGLITTSLDEDYGMNVVEAMASGKPVIAPNEGGYKESVINGKTGILIEEINSDKLVEAVKEISEKLKKDYTCYRKQCLNRARDFDTKVFISQIKSLIKSSIRNKEVD